MTSRMVTYRVKDGRAEENSAYVRVVMADLDATAPAGVAYSVFLLDDGVTFLHVVEGDSGPIQASEAFQRFSSTLAEDRCDGAPEQHTLTVVGRYVG
jgi:hypothetical protein